MKGIISLVCDEEYGVDFVSCNDLPDGSDGGSSCNDADDCQSED